ncbi:amidohydrolase family protein [Frankia gtarii]|uniref:amidohydrolase family protein n=1 Tax=Frankia gtarii TaxID=2950102 RepID=UPI0021C01179|nr:amidohydrolase family protein [Frankia gtarii]
MTVDDPDEFPLIVSVDDHVVEPGDLWTQRLPARYREIGPRTVRERIPKKSNPDEDKWADVWYYESVRVPVPRGFAAVSFEPDDLEDDPMTFDEMRPGCYGVADRLRDMDADGVEASVCFPNAFVRFCGQRFLAGEDRELALLSVQAYNDWLADEWCGTSDGRLLGAAIIPLWDATLAAAEIRRVSAKGLTSVAFSEIPARLGLPSMYSGYWDPFFAACEETQTVINLHIGSSSQTHTSSEDAPLAVHIANHFQNSAFSLSDWLVSGAFTRFPQLKTAFSEGQAGWIPFLLSRLDQLWDRHAPLLGLQTLPERPSHYVREHVYACVFNDPAALHLADQVGKHDIYQIGEDNLLFETDYPHNDSTFPHSVASAQQLTSGLTAEQRRKVLRTNAAKLYRVERVLTGAS